jgi:hypothetical protein
MRVPIAAVARDAMATLAGRFYILWPATLLCTLAGVSLLLSRDERLPAAIRLAAAAVGLALLALAQCVITWVGLHGRGGASVGMQRVFRALLVRWQALVVGSLIYAALVAAGMGGLDAVMEEFENGSSAYPTTPLVAVAPSHADIARDLPAQSIRLALIPASAMTWELLPRPDLNLPGTACTTFVPVGYPPTWDACPSLSPEPAGPAEMGGLLLLVAADILLRFRMVLALQPAGLSKCGRRSGPVAWVRPSVDSVRVTLRHLFVVAKHVWLLRLTIACMGGLFVVLPSLVERTWALAAGPFVEALIGTWANPLLQGLTSVAIALIGALVVAFCTLYDARFFVRL